MPPRSGSASEAIRASHGKTAQLAVVTFNQPKLLEWQIESLHDYFSDSYTLLVADNSTDADSSRRIEDICANTGVTYIRLRPRPRLAQAGGSASHGLALNWLYTNVLQHSQSEYLGLLDHDIFPIAPVSYAEVVGRQGAYGHFQMASALPFYWPGLHFFAPDYFSGGTPNFLPGTLGGAYGDTGSRNWRDYYSALDLSRLETFTQEDVRMDDPSTPFIKTGDLTTFVSEAFTLFDGDWVHMINGSNWAPSDQSSKLRQLQAVYLRDRGPAAGEADVRDSAPSDA